MLISFAYNNMITFEVEVEEEDYIEGRFVLLLVFFMNEPHLVMVFTIKC